MSSVDGPHFSATDVAVTFDTVMGPGWLGAALSAGAAAPGRIATASSASAKTMSTSIARRGAPRPALDMHVSSRAAYAPPDHNVGPATKLSFDSESVDASEELSSLSHVCR